MRKMLVVCLAFFCNALLLWGAGAAGISGKVMDSSGAVIAGVQIIVTNTVTGTSYTAMSDADGNYAVPGMESGTYTLTAMRDGFEVLRQENLRIEPGQAKTDDLTLHVGSAAQSVVVNAGILPGATAQPSQQDVLDSNQTIRVLDRKQMDVAGPVAGAAQVIALTPGANVTGYGNTGATKYTVTLNGINQGWGGYGGFTGGGSLGVTFDGVPVVDPATGLWQSPTIPEMGMIQNTTVTYGPGDPMDRWYTNIGGSVEFTPIQPAIKPHGDVTATYGSYQQKDIVFNAASGLYHGWSTAISGGAGKGDDFRQAPDGFANPGKDWAAFAKTLKSFQSSSVEFAGYYGYGGGYRSQVIPVVANPNITLDGTSSTPIYSQGTSGFYSTLPFGVYNKYDTNQMGLIYGRENVHLDSSTVLQNLSWYMHIRRSHDRYNDAYSPGPQQDEHNNPHTDTIGDKLEMSKTLPYNQLNFGAYYLHALYNSRNNFYNPADGGGKAVVNIGGKIRSSYFNQDDFAIYLQDDIHPVAKVHITPGLRYVGFATGYSNQSLQDFGFAPGVVLSTHCAANQTSTPGNTADQGSSCAGRENRSGMEPSVNATYLTNSWLTFYGGFMEALKAPEMGGGGGLFQAVDPATYHLARQSYYQVGAKIHTEQGRGRNNLLFGFSFFHQNYANQEIDVTNSAGNTVSANGTSVYHGVDVYLDDDPIAHLHAFVNATFESANYSNYVIVLPLNGSPGAAYNGLPVPYVPKSMVNFGAYYDLHPKGDMVIEPMVAFQFTGSQNIYDNNVGLPSNQTMPSFGTLDLGATVPLKHFDIKLNALNVLNKKYNIYEYVSSGAYFGTPSGGYTLAYPGAPATVYGSFTAHF